MYKIMTFVSTLFIGFASGSGIVEITSPDANASKANSVNQCVESETDREQISIGLKRIVSAGTERIIEFSISNQSCEPVKYHGYAKNSLMYEIKTDGKEIQNFWCGTGLEEFELAPGESISVSVPASLVSNTGTADSIFSVGFMSHWSDGFSLPLDLFQNDSGK